MIPHDPAELHVPDADGMAASRAASCYNYPGHARRVHVAAGGWLAACNGMLLAEFTGMPAETVPEHVRCHRPGCRVRWPVVRREDGGMNTEHDLLFAAREIMKQRARDAGQPIVERWHNHLSSDAC